MTVRKRVRGKGVANATIFLPERKTIQTIQTWNPKGFINTPDRDNTPPYNQTTEQQFQPAPQPDNKILQTPNEQGAGSKFLHKRHPASKPLQFGPLSRAAQ
jgi:hypothetical protein